VLTNVALPLPTTPFAEGDGRAGTAFPAPTGAWLGVGMVAAVFLGCLSGTAAPTCTEIQAWLPSEGRSQQSIRLTVKQCNSAETQLNCDNNKCLVTDRHRQCATFAGKAQVLTQAVCVTRFKTCLLPQLGQIDAFDTEQDVSWYLKTKHDTCAAHHIQMMAATQNTLHVVLFSSHARACGTGFGQSGLVSDLATLQTCMNKV